MCRLLPLDRLLGKPVFAIGLSVILLLFVLGGIPVWIPWSTDLLAQTKDKAGADKSTGLDDHYMYMGAASCSGSACHGSTTPRNKLGIGQNEFYIWSEKDDHTKAYDILTKSHARIIAKNLKIAKPEESDRCLVCHTMQTNADRQGKLFDVTDGVSCEACHGAAERWLGPHIRKDWDAKKAAEFGMYPTKDLAKRAEKCLECHAGTDGKVVDHELIGAGHPRLKFELDNYSYSMPAHWRQPKEKQDRDWLATRTWAVGQAMALRNEIRRLASSRRSKVGLWPDLTHFDCFSCHHAVVDHRQNLSEQEKNEQRWRFKDYEGRPGRLVWNAAGYSILRHIVTQISPEEGRALEQLIKALYEGLSGKSISHESFSTTLTSLSDLSDRLVSQVSQYTFTQQTALSLMKNLSGDSQRLAGAGFQSAEQAVFALASLYDAYLEAVGSLPEEKAVKATIDALYNDVKGGQSFNPSKFEADMSKVHAYLK